RYPPRTRRVAAFFCSRRRRHTRFSRDWSSDVCSSDLWADGWTRPMLSTPSCRSLPTSVWITHTCWVIRYPYSPAKRQGSSSLMLLLLLEKENRTRWKYFFIPLRKQEVRLFLRKTNEWV